MKKVKKYLFICVLSVLCGMFFVPQKTEAYAMETKPYRSAYLIDYDTGTVLESYRENDKHPIASMVKIMTLLLTFQEIEKGNLSYDETVRISEYAAGMGGSQLFLSVNGNYPVNDLIQGVIVCSANDCAVALGERIAGSNEAFVRKMNERAKEIGMENTLFCNATGLPCDREQYSTAKDVTVMMQKLLHFPQYYEYTKIWMKDYTHPDGRVTQMVNTNKLIRQSPDCDAGKTGFTQEAMFCLSASAKQGETRLVGTVLGSPDGKTRFNAMKELFQTAFARYETTVLIRKGEEIPFSGTVKNAKNLPQSVFSDADIKFFCEKGKKGDFVTKFVRNDEISAPISKGTSLGKIVVEDENGNKIGEADLLCSEDIEKMSFWDSLKKVIEHWKIFR